MTFNLSRADCRSRAIEDGQAPMYCNPTRAPQFGAKTGRCIDCATAALLIVDPAYASFLALSYLGLDPSSLHDAPLPSSKKISCKSIQSRAFSLLLLLDDDQNERQESVSIAARWERIRADPAGGYDYDGALLLHASFIVRLIVGRAAPTGKFLQQTCCLV